MLSVLPNELIDRIIDFLWNDRKALHNCALACRLFLPSSRYHLFSHIRVTSRAGLGSVLNAWRSSYLCKVIRSLDLVERQDEQWVHLTPHVLGEFLHRIESLTVRHVNWSESPPSFFLVLPVFTQLTHLALHDCLFTTFYDLQQLLCELPRLENLTIGAEVRWKFGEPAFLPLEFPSPEARVSNLCITALCVLPVLGVLSTDKFVTAILQWLTGLMLPLWRMELTISPVAGRLIQAMLATLEHLALNIYDQIADASLGLSQCMNLRALSLKFCELYIGIANSFVDRTSLLCDILSCVPAENCLAQLKVDVSSVVVKDIDWKRVGGVLALPRFRYLKELLIFYHWPHQQRSKLKAWRKETRAKLSSVYRRGVLVQFFRPS